MSTQRPERLLAIVIVLLLTAAIVAAVALSQGSDGSQTVSTAPEASGLPAGALLATVVHVTDGDTIVVSIGGVTERVRYVGLDAPEVAHPQDGTPAECGSDAARDANAELVDGREVALERDTSERDRFGRLLRHVWVAGAGGWLLVGERLIEIGAAEARTYEPDTSHDDEFADAERDARAAGLGIWGSC
jgi:micrococcal nuclease